MKSYDSIPEFEKEFKRLLKKFRTLEGDLENFKQVLESYPTGVGQNFTIIHSTETVKVVKARLACRSLRDRSLRIIYSYFEFEEQVIFLELYHKADKANEDRERIKEFLNTHI